MDKHRNMVKSKQAQSFMFRYWYKNDWLAGLLQFWSLSGKSKCMHWCRYSLLIANFSSVIEKTSSSCSNLIRLRLAIFYSHERRTTNFNRCCKNGMEVHYIITERYKNTKRAITLAEAAAGRKTSKYAIYSASPTCLFRSQLRPWERSTRQGWTSWATWEGASLNTQITARAPFFSNAYLL